MLERAYNFAMDLWNSERSFRKRMTDMRARTRRALVDLSWIIRDEIWLQFITRGLNAQQRETLAKLDLFSRLHLHGEIIHSLARDCRDLGIAHWRIELAAPIIIFTGIIEDPSD